MIVISSRRIKIGTRINILVLMELVIIDCDPKIQISETMGAVNLVYFKSGFANCTWAIISLISYM